MKLRIKSDSIRIRLTQSEVASLTREGEVRQQTSFDDNACFVTRVSLGDVNRLTARLRSQGLDIIAPADQGRAWAIGDAIALESAGRPHILVEKDFACLHARDGDSARNDDEDTFPRPAAGPK